MNVTSIKPHFVSSGKDRHMLMLMVVVHCILVFYLCESCLCFLESLRYLICELIDRLEF
jgi:hypothetical protein